MIQTRGQQVPRGIVQYQTGVRLKVIAASIGIVLFQVRVRQELKISQTEGQTGILGVKKTLKQILNKV